MYLYRMGNDVSNHELSHQWGHYFDWQAIIGIQGWGIHTPLWGHYESPLTVNSMISSNLQLRPLGGVEWEVVKAPAPTQIPPLQVYAMGRLEASAVPPVDIFENQNRPRLRPGDRVSGATRRATIDQIVAHHGPRVGPTVTTVRRATILLSRDALATPAEMAYWTLMAQRLEDPDQTGMISEAGIGSFHAISGVTLNTGVIPPAGGPILSGHTTLEPDVLDPHDLAGVVLDTAPRLDVPALASFVCRAASSILCSLGRAASLSTMARAGLSPRASRRMAASASSVRRKWPRVASSSTSSSRLAASTGPSHASETSACSSDLEWRPAGGPDGHGNRQQRGRSMVAGHGLGANELPPRRRLVARRLRHPHLPHDGNDIVSVWRAGRSVLPARSGGQRSRRERSLVRSRAHRGMCASRAPHDAHRRGERRVGHAWVAAEFDERRVVHRRRRIDQRREQHRRSPGRDRDVVDRRRSGRALLRSRAGGDALRRRRFERD